MMKKTFILMVMMLFFVGCGAPDAPAPAEPVATVGGAEVEATAVLPEPTTAVESNDSSGYPVVENENSSGYPVPEQPSATTLDEGYPPSAEPTRATDGVLFSINGPVTVGQTTISGTAPPRLSLALVNITYNGALLGTGSSDSDGNFSINVSPIPEGVRVGLTLSQLDDYPSLDAAVNDLYPYRGDNFMNVPNVGIYFETVRVGE